MSPLPQYPVAANYPEHSRAAMLHNYVGLELSQVKLKKRHSARYRTIKKDVWFQDNMRDSRSALREVA